MKIGSNYGSYGNYGNYCQQKSPSFKKFEQLEVYGLMEKDGEIKKNVMEKLNSSPFFQALCKKYDVIVKMGTKRIMGGYESACKIFYKQPVQKSEKGFLRGIISHIINPFIDYQSETITSSSSNKNHAENKIAEICTVSLDKIKYEMERK